MSQPGPPSSSLRRAAGKREAYSFGQDAGAARRLEMLAEVFRASSSSLIRDLVGLGPFRTVVDLGCGPGWSTQLLKAHLAPERLTGLDTASGFLDLARRLLPDADWIQHDVAVPPLPGCPADLIYARYVLTHLPNHAARLGEWVHQTTPGGIVLVEDNTGIDTDNPTFHLYLEIVNKVIAASGGDLYVGGSLDPAALGVAALIDRVAEVSASTALTASMFRLNLSSWRMRPAAGPFATEVARLDAELQDLEQSQAVGEITWRVRQLAIRRGDNHNGK